MNQNVNINVQFQSLVWRKYIDSKWLTHSKEDPNYSISSLL